MSGLGQKFNNWHFRRQGLYLALIGIGYGLANDWRCDSINPVLASPWTIGIITVFCLYLCRWLRRQASRNAGNKKFYIGRENLKQRLTRSQKEIAEEFTVAR